MSESSDSDEKELSSVNENESSTDHSSRNVNQDEKDHDVKAEITKKETQAVFRLRVLVIVIMFLAAIAVSVVVYMITTQAEHDTFVTSYEGAAQKIIDSFESILEKIGTISSVGIAATIHGLDHIDVEKWPFITLTSFQQRSATARFLSGALYVTISPLVQDHDVPEWEQYVVGPANGWIAEGFAYQEDLGIDSFELNDTNTNEILLNQATGNQIFYFDENGAPQVDSGPGPYLPTWETSPVLRRQNVNENLARRKDGLDVLSKCVHQGQAVLEHFETAPPGSIADSNKLTSLLATLRSIVEQEEVHYLGDPMARLFLPIFDSFENDRTPVAVLMSVIHWRSYLRKILPNNIRGITVVLENSCDGYFSYVINGDEAYVLGFGDHHDKSFDNMQRKATFSINTVITDGTKNGTQLNQEDCHYSLHVYPSREFYRVYITRTPLVITFAVAMVFVFTAGMFLVYDRIVERRQKLVLSKAAQSSAIVSSLFPRQVRDRLLQMEGERQKDGKMMAPTHRLKSFLHGESHDHDHGLTPIADLFPHCTVLFADIAGFTAWSSTREPEQVFVLLQTVYQAFDILAKRRRVFKVETIGDSYVAVTGLPEPQPSHAVIMIRFAWECMQRMSEVSKDLEVSLGPDTGDLSMRFGLHSGPVTAGVLRGDRARFQLFGDTVNTASRMESTGYRGRIQISQATADQLTLAGKGHWVTPREDVVEAKGKGVLHTFWANPTAKKASEQDSEGDRADDANDGVRPTQTKSQADLDIIKRDRLVDWMVELFIDHIKKIVAKRNVMGVKPRFRGIKYTPPAGVIVLDEVKESITMPKFDARAIAEVEDYRAVTISPDIIDQLRHYVKSVSLTYHENPFHNFEHACHVTMSVNKLLKRIVAPDLNAEELKRVSNTGDMASHLHDYTHGINSDPLASLAIVYSAMIHDADHRGVSNAQLIQEDPVLGKLYRNKSVAEQNSVDVAWKLLMQDGYDELRSYIFATESELLRFRQMIVNVVLATDIFDKELNDLRKSRWEKAFQEEHSLRVDNLDLKATIVIEHIIQASDVSHTMQHWHIYRKWNQRLFTELYLAFRAGRMGADPTAFWYKGELGFFDNYIIPLAKKLKECNVFGVSSDEYLNYAVRNRAEWEERGQELVAEMLEDVKKELGIEEVTTD